MEHLISTFKEDLKEFQKMTEKFYAGEINTKEYKGFSGGFGSYAQRGGTASMLRLRLPGGQVTKEKLKFVADAVKEYHITKAHLTTCQTIQLHDLKGDAVCEIMEKALDAGIITRGGGGDFPRNVMVSPLSGVEKGEYFDVLPYAVKVSDYLLGVIKTVKLPRKLKVGFSNSPANVTHATFRDLGFVAKENGCFDVYSAGGLGNNYRMGVLVAQDIDPSQVLFYVEAMVRTFTAYGNYESRAKSRTRYMQETLGAEGYKKAYLEKLDEVISEGNCPSISIESTSVKKSGNGSSLSDSRAICQKQEGLYAVAYHPIGGIVPVEKFAQLYELIKDMDEVQLRISPDETLYIINLNADEAKQVLKATSDGAKNLFETSVSCIGSSICQIGLRDSQGLLNAIIEEVEPYHFADGVLPKIHISGCTSSCGTHQIGSLGFHGSVKRVDNTPAAAFTLHVGGCDLQGDERFGEEWGAMTAQDIPKFFVDLGQHISAKSMTYETWYAAYPQELRALAEPYLK